MATSVANVQYDSYSFSPVPQVGIRDNTKRLGESGFGPGSIERVVTLKGKIFGDNHNDVQTKIWALQAAFAKSGKTLLWNDGSTNRINQVAQPLSVDIPADWQQYEAEYTITLLYFPLTETHYAPISVSYNGYNFAPIPALGRDYQPVRETPESARSSAKVTITLQGFIDKGSVSANFTELAALQTAMAGDGTLTYGTFVQAVRAGRLSTNPDVGDRRIAYTVSFDYDTEAGANGVTKFSSSRSIQNSERVAKNYVPFQDDALIQRLGRNGQVIAATGFVVCDTMVNARIAAQSEIAAQFPVVSGSVEEQRNIVEKATEKRVEWQVSVFYPVPTLTGGVYGGSPVF